MTEHPSGHHSQIPPSEQKVIDKFSKMGLKFVRIDPNFVSTPNAPSSKKIIGSGSYFVGKGHIVELNIFRKNSLRNLPDIIENLSELQILNIDDSEIEFLPECIGKLKNLVELGIPQGRLTSLPESFGNLTNLEVLSMYRNKLHSLPESIGNLTKLEEVYLSGNFLTRLPESFKNLKCYKLSLEWNPLKSLSNINFDNLFLYGFTANNLTTKGKNLLRPFWGDESVLYDDESSYDDKKIERNLKPLAKYYEHSSLVLVKKYCNDPKSLSPDELERLTWESGQIERDLLESRFPPENSIIRKIVDRLKVELKNGYNILL